MLTFVNLLLNPMLLFWLLVGSWAVLRYYKRSRQSRICALAAGIWLFLISVSPLPIYLVYLLEKQHKPLFVNERLRTSDRPIHIVILGGGHSYAPGHTAADHLSSDALGRLAEGVRLYHQLTGSKLICTGFAQHGPQSQAEVLAEAALDLGANPADTLLLPTPSRTQEEAETYRKQLYSNETVLLVTSALHMTRASRWFEIEKVPVIPAPTNFQVKINPEKYPWNFIPSPSKIGMMHRAMHEYLGLLLQKRYRVNL